MRGSFVAITQCPKKSRSRYRARIAQRRAAFRNPLSRRNIGEMMLLPILILILVLTGRGVVGENIDNCAGSANDPIEWPRTHVNSNTARTKPCRRNAIRVRTVTEYRVVGVILG